MDVVTFYGEAFLYCLAQSKVFVDFQASLMARMLYLTNPFSSIPINFCGDSDESLEELQALLAGEQ